MKSAIRVLNFDTMPSLLMLLFLLLYIIDLVINILILFSRQFIDKHCCLIILYDSGSNSSNTEHYVLCLHTKLYASYLMR